MTEDKRVGAFDKPAPSLRGVTYAGTLQKATTGGAGGVDGAVCVLSASMLGT